MSCLNAFIFIHNLLRFHVVDDDDHHNANDDNQYRSLAMGGLNNSHSKSCEGFGPTCKVGMVVNSIANVAKDSEYKDDNKGGHTNGKVSQSFLSHEQHVIANPVLLVQGSQHQCPLGITQILEATHATLCLSCA